MGKRKNSITQKKEELIELLVCDILNGMSRYRVRLKMERDQYPDYTTSTMSRSGIYKYIDEAYELCKVPLGKKRDAMRELQLSRLEDILEEARDSRDRQNAIGAIKEINKLAGLYEPEKVDVTGTINVNIDFGLDNGSES